MYRFLVPLKKISFISQLPNGRFLWLICRLEENNSLASYRSYYSKLYILIPYVAFRNERDDVSFSRFFKVAIGSQNKIDSELQIIIIWYIILYSSMIRRSSIVYRLVPPLITHHWQQLIEQENNSTSALWGQCKVSGQPTAHTWLRLDLHNI